MTLRSRIWLALSALLAIVGVSGCEQGNGTGSPMGGMTPPSINRGGTWINPEEPLRLSDLKGKVVWLEFSFLR